MTAETTARGPSPLLEMRDIVKAFPGGRALDGVSFSVARGEVHALVGENGAGKSTLMKVLSGVWPAGSFDGGIYIDGVARRFRSVGDSEAAGVAVIFQELALVPEMTVTENIFLGCELTRLGVIANDLMAQRTAALLERLDAPFTADTRVDDLSVGQQQLVEIAKALQKQARLLVLDEPTAALAETEVATLLSIIRRLRQEGTGLIYISHKLSEVFAIADRITVLRDGCSVASTATTATDEREIVAQMVGRDLTEIFPPRPQHGDEVCLTVADLRVRDPAHTERVLLEDLSFAVRRGEIFGIAGLMGAGRTELLTTLFGLAPGPASGSCRLDGQPYWPRSPSEAKARGVAYVSEDRKRFSLVPGQSVAGNLSLASLRVFSHAGVIDDEAEAAACNEHLIRLRIRAASLDTDVETLSGGNQQKVVLGRWLMTAPQLLLLDDPTRGVDIGAKHEQYRLICDLAAAGKSIILASSELPELLHLCHRILVLAAGRSQGVFEAAESSAEAIMFAATRSRQAVAS